MAVVRRCGRIDCAVVSAKEVDEYLSAVDEPKRGTLQALPRTILEIVPEAEQVISYVCPPSKIVAGFAAFKDHLSYLPFIAVRLDQIGQASR
jgi:uncharacterized protein YdhG (YjbR/CyaY superfamily)